MGLLEFLVTYDIISHVTIETIPLSHLVVEILLVKIYSSIFQLNDPELFCVFGQVKNIEFVNISPIVAVEMNTD